eukprot:1146673-Pelagomonas_calceolata.AAC.1
MHSILFPSVSYCTFSEGKQRKGKGYIAAPACKGSLAVLEALTAALTCLCCQSECLPVMMQVRPEGAQLKDLENFRLEFGVGLT